MRVKLHLSMGRLKHAINPGKIDEIKQLFINTFSDSEGESEGRSIGNLVFDLITTTDESDIHGFVAIEKG